MVRAATRGSIECLLCRCLFEYTMNQLAQNVCKGTCDYNSHTQILEEPFDSDTSKHYLEQVVLLKDLLGFFSNDNLATYRRCLMVEHGVLKVIQNEAIDVHIILRTSFAEKDADKEYIEELLLASGQATTSSISQIEDLKPTMPFDPVCYFYWNLMHKGLRIDIWWWATVVYLVSCVAAFVRCVYISPGTSMWAYACMFLWLTIAHTAIRLSFKNTPILMVMLLLAVDLGMLACLYLIYGYASGTIEYNTDI